MQGHAVKPGKAQPAPSQPRTQAAVARPGAAAFVLQRALGTSTLGAPAPAGYFTAGSGALPMSRPDDASEREATAIAARVMSLPVGATASSPLVQPSGGPRVARAAAGGHCPACQQAMAQGLPRPCSACGTAPAQSAGGTSGSPLADGVRQGMEARFGADFSGVRIHTDPGAGALDALAYTVGSDIFFAPGQYAPGSARGDLLLAHELTHVLQQGGGAQGLGIHRAPVGLYRYMAGGCCVPHVPSTTIGTWIHDDVELMMYGINPVMQAEVPIPGAGTTGPFGFTDLYMSLPPFLQPAGPTHRMPGRVGAPFPNPLGATPWWAGMGSIKPITFGYGAGLADLARYVTAFNTFYTASGGTGVGGTALPYPTNPAWLVPGVPFLHAPLWLPQDLHIFSLLDGMYWYFCTPSATATALAIWLARYIAQKLSDFLDEMERVLGPVVQAIARAVVQALDAIAAAVRAVIDFIAEHWLAILLIILAVVAIILIIVFWEVIVAAVLAAGAAVAAFGEGALLFLTDLLAGASAAIGPILARGLAASVAGGVMLFPLGARAATPDDFSEAAASDQPSIPGGLQPQRPLPPGGSGAAVNLNDATALVQRAANLDPHSLSAGVAVCDEAERMAGAFSFGGPVISALEAVKHLLERAMQHGAGGGLGSAAAAGAIAGAAAAGAGGGVAAGAAGAAGAGAAGIAGGAEAGASGAAAPPSSAGGPPTAAPPAAAPPQPSPGSAGSAGATGSGSGRALGTGSGAGVWPILFEELGTSGHFQILPGATSVDPGGTLAITDGRNASAVLHVSGSGASATVRNSTTGEEGQVAPSTLLPGGWRLVSGPMAVRLEAVFSEWRRHNRRPRLNDLVYPQLHFR